MVRTAGVFLVNKNFELLICRITNSNPVTYSIPKGLIDKGEDEHDAAIRELLEETNVNIKDYHYLRVLPEVKYKAKEKTLYPHLLFEHENGFDFNAFELKCNSLVNNDFPEVDEFRWVSLNEVHNYIHESQTRCIPEIKRIIEFIKDEEE